MSKYLNNLRTGKTHDNRRRLTDFDRERIKAMYSRGEAIRAIAKEFQGLCSRRLIQFVLFPERDRKLKEQAKKRKAWALYYDTEKRKLYQRKHREHVREINGLPPTAPGHRNDLTLFKNSSHFS